MCPKFRHYRAHSGFVLLEQQPELFVFMEKRLIFYNKLGIHALEFRLEGLFRYICVESAQSKACSRMNSLGLQVRCN